MEHVAGLAKLAEMYDVPLLLAWCEADLCRKSRYMHFEGTHFHSLPETLCDWGSSDGTAVWSATEWLAFADRLGLERLMVACATVVMNGLYHKDLDGIGLAGLSKLIKEYNLSSRSAMSITMAFRNSIVSIPQRQFDFPNYLKQRAGDLHSSCFKWLQSHSQ